MSRPVGVERSFFFSIAALALCASVHAGAVTRLTSNAVDETGTDAAIDVAGNVHVVYERAGSVYYRGRTGAIWSDEELVATGTNPAVGAGASGVPQVAFLSGGGVWFTARLGGAWIAPVQIGSGSSVDLAVGANDVAHVVYLGNYFGDGYSDIVYTNNDGGSFPVEPVKTWNGWYYNWGGGSGDGNYFYAPVIAADDAGHFAIAYRFMWWSRYPGGTDWATSLHVYRSATDDDVSSGDWYKGTYPDVRNNGLALADTGTAYVVQGTALGTVAGPAWTTVSLPAGSSHTVRTSPAAAVHLAWVDGAGGIDYAVDTGTGFGPPVVLDATTTGRNPVVVAQGDPFVAYEAVDSGDYEVWFARTANQAPVLDAVGDKSVDEGAPLSFTVSATDADGDELVYSASNLPLGASFDPATRTFSWTPAFDQAGAHAGVVFSVSDGGATDSESVTITVNQVNAPPVLATIGNRSVDENAALSFTLSATDMDGDTLSYTASNLPTGAAFDAGSATFSWTPDYDQAGAHTAVVFTVTDSGLPNLSDSETITITVNNVNRAPVLGPIGDRTVDEASPLSFTVAASDGDGDALTYSASNLPAGASFDAGTRVFSWTPGYDQAGTFAAVVFTVSDGNASDAESVTITVNDVNAPPVLATIGDRSVNEADTLSFTVSATDHDGNALTFGASNLPAGASFDAATRTFSWIPGYDQAGAHTGIVFTVVDDGTPSRSDSETITVTVNNVNRAPVLDPIGDKSTDEGVKLSFAVSATDADGDALSFSVSNLPTGATFDPATRIFSWTPGYDQSGSHPALLFTVDDGTTTDSESLTITVNDNPTPPGFFTVIPCRVLDTRNADGPYGGPALVAGAARTFTIAGQCGIPPTATAVSVNLTVTQPSTAGNVRLYPGGVPMPLVSTINYTTGLTRANNAIVPLDALSEMVAYCSQASGTVHFILDVNGYFQ
jgi:hypothetical protein